MRADRRRGLCGRFGHKQLSGTANYLACRIANELGCKARGIELSTLQRAASHLVSRIDIIEAYQVGGAAVKAADEGDTGEMVILERISDDPYQCTTSLRNVHKVSNVEKVVPRKWINEDGDYVTEEFLNYVKPLIQEMFRRSWWTVSRDICITTISGKEKRTATP